tara:strand:+ start:771 stop:1208 length:438 start_codon:yes stop_codon:yes gene_type:complete
MKRVRIKSKELPYNYPVSKKDAVEKCITEDYVVYTVNGAPLFFECNSEVIPTIKCLLKEPLLATVTVDMGAVRFVVNGADIMGPGITSFTESVREGDYVAIVDETHGKVLSVCKSLIDGDTFVVGTKGKVLQNVHYVGDKLWNLL